MPFSFKYIERAYEIISELKGDESLEAALVIKELAFINKYVKNYEKAKECYQIAIKILEKDKSENYFIDLADCYKHLGIMHLV